LLGLGMRAGHLVIGVDGVRSALQRNDVRCLVLASDASPRATEKTLALARAQQIPVVEGPVAEELGRKLGRPPVMAVGVRDRALAQGILQGNTQD
jgi:ribosomal protein L7Ae-like RNA K-turn-binding protein